VSRCSFPIRSLPFPATQCLTVSSVCASAQYRFCAPTPSRGLPVFLCVHTFRISCVFCNARCFFLSKVSKFCVTSICVLSNVNFTCPCSKTKVPGYRRRCSDLLRAGRPRDRSSSPGRSKNSLFSTSSRPVLGSTRASIDWVPGALSPG
jgi:hypothetical protein